MPLAQEQINRLIELAGHHEWRLLILFGSTARGEDGRDVDLAVMPRETPDLMTHGRWQREVEAIVAPKPADVVVLHAGISPLLRYQVLWTGECLYEAEPGLFEHEQDRAFFLYADTKVWQQHNAEALDGS